MRAKTFYGTQHFFRPKFLPEPKTFRDQDFSGPQIFSWPTIFCNSNFFRDSQFFWTQDLLGLKISWTKNPWNLKFLGHHLGTQNFRDTEFFKAQNSSGPKIFLDQTFFMTHIFSGPKTFQDPQSFGSQIFRDPKFSGTLNFSQEPLLLEDHLWG